jgi:glycosyltransferase involved in cell wall biosynthesis
MSTATCSSEIETCPPTQVAARLGHVVILTNYIPPHALPFYSAFSERCEKLTMLLSTQMESNRHWQADWGGLDVQVQKTLTIKRPWRHPVGFEESLEIHFPRDTIRRIKQLRPDVIISEQFGYRSLMASLYRTCFRRVPLAYWVCLSEHTEQGRGVSRRMLRKWLVSRADAIGVNGRSGERYLHHLGMPQDRTCVVPYTAVTNVFDRLPATRTPEAAHRLLYSGQLIELKGLPAFVKTLARWATDHPDRRIEFNLVGSGPQQEAIASVPRPANLELNLLGQRDFAELAQIYGEHGILVSPTLSDEWGMVVNEAMAAGMPVLGSVFGQAGLELIDDGENGWQFRPDDSDDVYRAIDRALTTTPERLNDMRQAARQRVAHITPSYAAEQLAKLSGLAIAHAYRNKQSAAGE